MAKTQASTSSKAVTADKSHHHSYCSCWCTYFHIHSPEIYLNTVETGSLPHPELCKKEAARPRCNTLPGISQHLDESLEPREKMPTPLEIKATPTSRCGAREGSGWGLLAAGRGAAVSAMQGLNCERASCWYFDYCMKCFFN